jgi:D-alanine-D-alanine ligase
LETIKTRTPKKSIIGLVCGGEGAEHAVDLISVAEVQSGFDPDRYAVIILAIDKAGNWHFGREADDCIRYADRIDRVELIMSAPIVDLLLAGKIRNRATGEYLANVDIFFPITDDPVQERLAATGKPYVGSPPDGIALCRDKDASKRVLSEAGFNVAPYTVVTRKNPLCFADAADRFGLPLFIKPNSLGSSIGISKVNNQREYDQGMAEAFRYDRKVLVEKTMAGREVECAVIGNENPEAAAVLGEVINIKGFFDFKAKYHCGEEGKIIIPASVNVDVVERIRDSMIAAYRLLRCAGYARFDIFLFPDNSFAIIEVNASPGLASHLMYPRLWRASDLSHRRLLDRLIRLAQKRG